MEYTPGRFTLKCSDHECDSRICGNVVFIEVEPEGPGIAVDEHGRVWRDPSLEKSLEETEVPHNKHYRCAKCGKHAVKVSGGTGSSHAEDAVGDDALLTTGGRIHNGMLILEGNGIEFIVGSSELKLAYKAYRIGTEREFFFDLIREMEDRIAELCDIAEEVEDWELDSDTEWELALAAAERWVDTCQVPADEIEDRDVLWEPIEYSLKLPRFAPLLRGEELPKAA